MTKLSKVCCKFITAHKEGKARTMRSASRKMVKICKARKGEFDYTFEESEHVHEVFDIIKELS